MKYQMKYQLKYVNQQMGISHYFMLFKIIFLNFCIKIMQKHVKLKKGDFNQGLECLAFKRWLKCTTCITSLKKTMTSKISYLGSVMR